MVTLEERRRHTPRISPKATYITGQLLRELCVAEWQRSLPRAQQRTIDSSRLHIIQVGHPEFAFRSVIRFIAAADVMEHLFDLHEDLFQRDAVLVLSHRDTLGEVAVDRRSMAAATDAPARAGPAGKQARPSASPRQSTSSHAKASARSSKHLRPESTFEMISAHTATEDMEDVNELIDNGTIAVGEAIATYLCAQCFHLPAVTLTMSCCGCLLCTQCAPTPPTVQTARPEDRICPVCGEEPLEPPQSHLQRDEEVQRLVKELKVLYLPQARQLRQRAEQSAGLLGQLNFSVRESPILGPM
ncbi:hypothetical protein STCU_08221 [Strigomonas culicis]|uniref:Uncharacterized protein n=1 Tax=Strigomonas culicis TaxID=28005 RepID=S9VH28_9TRYP|nr:hypothetical protein STCU_08221 [Strigomonas culicis]|eukprot:EPY22560.1 hypothetical protein STCU_08221 [Strigomonas culicis]